MMLFVLIHDRRKQQIVRLKRFPDNQRVKANQFHFEAEQKALRENLGYDVILFQADSENDLRRTHGSYFFNEREMFERAIGEFETEE